MCNVAGCILYGTDLALTLYYHFSVATPAFVLVLVPKTGEGGGAIRVSSEHLLCH